MNESAGALGGNVFQMNPITIKMQNRKAMSEILREDIRQNRIQNYFFQSMKMQSLGTFAGILAHDFNNILGTILASSSLLEMEKISPEKHASILKAINNAVGRGAELIGRMLSFTGRTDVIFKPVHIPNFVNDLFTDMKQSFPANIKLEQKIDENISNLNIDRAKIRQALINLCINACDAMPDGGTLSIEVRRVSNQEIQSVFPVAKHDQYICISVSDTGVGIDETSKEMIFDPFYTTKGKGKGLGLSVVYGIIRAHQGFIDVESKPKIGSTFYLYFPTIIEASEIIDLIKEKNPGEISGTETILVVEDENYLLDLARIMFEAKGYKVITARDGMDAIEKFKQNQDKISIVFTDIGMPRLNGKDMFEKLKELDPKVKVIFTSGIFVDIKAELLKNGAKDFIQKPYKQEDVLRKIREVLDSK